MPIDKKGDLAKTHDEELEMVEALWGGTFKMREAGVKYLPQEDKEHNNDYKARKLRSVLTNFFKKTIKSQSGKVCSQKIVVTDDDKAEEYAENIDSQGRDLHRFSHSLSQKAMRDGLRLILIDAPSAEEIKTLKLTADKIRPYWIEIDRSSIIDWEEINGVLQSIRLKETVYVDDDEFTQKPVEQIRVLEPNLVQIYRKADDSWSLHQEHVTTYAFVPIVPLYAGSPDFPLVCEPSFTDLAHMNVQHWQKTSDHDNILHVSSIAHLFVSGVQPEVDDGGNKKEITFGPNGLTQTSNANADMKFVEHSGAASGAVSENIEQLGDNARAIGADFATPKPGVMTATQRIIEEGGNLSELTAFALNLQDTLTLAFEMTMEMIGREFKGEVKVKTDFREYSMTLSPKDLLESRVAGEIDRETYLKILMDRTGLDISIENVVEALKVEFDDEFGKLDFDRPG